MPSHAHGTKLAIAIPMFYLLEVETANKNGAAWCIHVGKDPHNRGSTKRTVLLSADYCEPPGPAAQLPLPSAYSCWVLPAAWPRLPAAASQCPPLTVTPLTSWTLGSPPGPLRSIVAGDPRVLVPAAYHCWPMGLWITHRHPLKSFLGGCQWMIKALGVRRWWTANPTTLRSPIAMLQKVPAGDTRVQEVDGSELRAPGGSGR